jgi:hypothetical protein
MPNLAKIKKERLNIQIHPYLQPKVQSHSATVRYSAPPSSLFCEHRVSPATFAAVDLSFL